MENLTGTDILMAAAGLLSDEDNSRNREQNAEARGYDRALADLAGTLVGLDDSDEVMSIVLRGIREALDA